MSLNEPIDSRKAVELIYKNARLIWWSFFLTQTLLMLYFSKLFVYQKDALEVQTLQDILIVVGLSFLVLGWVAPKYILKLANRRGVPTPVSTPLNQAESTSLIQGYFSAFVVRLMGIEGAALVACVAFMGGAGSSSFIGLFFLSAASFFLKYPTQRFLDSWAGHLKT